MAGGARLTAALMCGAGHSGSTLLGMVLGSHPLAFYMGEGGKAQYLGDISKPPHKRMCKICGEGCAVWGEFRWDRARPLYPQVAERSGRRVIIDSTKNGAWIAERIAETRAAGGEPCLFLLLRDGRAVVNSRLRKHPDSDPERTIRDWMAQMERSEALYAGFDGPKMRVRYEDFAARPEPVARAACDLLGLPFEPAMLRYQAAEHHPLGGNNGPQFMAARERQARHFVTVGQHNRGHYEAHDGEIRLDLRWRDEFSATNLALFESIAGQMNNRMMIDG